ncbi:MAG: FG-GAP repeat domain-containing protein [Candidatus Hodarchaeales archaeon]
MGLERRTCRMLFLLITILILFNLGFVKILAKNIDFQEHLIVEGFTSVMSVDPVDLDNDGDIDILVSSDSGNEIAWWQNDGKQNFTKQVVTSDFTGAFKAHAVDLDDDGDIDILGASSMSAELAWWENDGDQSFTKHVVVTQYFGASTVNSYDVDRDGDIDLLSTASYDISWWENDGQEVFTKNTLVNRSQANSRRYIFHIYAVDLDNDNDIDLLSGDNYWGSVDNDNTIFYWLNDGNGIFDKYELQGTHYATFHGLYVSDVDNDGDIDFCSTSPSNNTIDWFENDGELNFTRNIVVNDFQGANSVFVTDMDNDGDKDLLGAAYLGDKISWFENNGNQQFTEHVIVTDYDTASICLANDIDQDGDYDVIGATWSSKITWWESSNEISTNVTDSTLTDSNGISSVGLEIISVILACYVSIRLKRSKKRLIHFSNKCEKDNKE